MRQSDLTKSDHTRSPNLGFCFCSLKQFFARPVLITTNRQKYAIILLRDRGDLQSIRHISPHNQWNFLFAKFLDRNLQWICLTFKIHENRGVHATLKSAHWFLFPVIW